MGHGRGRRVFAALLVRAAITMPKPKPKPHSHLPLAPSLMWGDRAQFPDLVNQLIDRIGRRGGGFSAAARKGGRERGRERGTWLVWWSGREGGGNRKGLKMHTSEQCDDGTGGDSTLALASAQSPMANHHRTANHHRIRTQTRSIITLFARVWRWKTSMIPHIF